MSEQRDLERLSAMLADSRKRTLELVSDLSEEQMLGPRLKIVNPPLWEIGHLAWFQERWNLRRRDENNGFSFGPSILTNADDLYDSMQVAHDARWGLPLLSCEDTLTYMRRVLDGTVRMLETEGPTVDAVYFARLATFHEDMHAEAFTYTRNTHGLGPPPISDHDPTLLEGQPSGALEGDMKIPGGTFMLGATRDLPFVFDNEKWVHPVEGAPFEIARAPVTNAGFAAFVDDEGYRRWDLWSEEGWGWRESVSADHPVYWRRSGDGTWLRRHFDRTDPLPPHHPVIHVNWHEAEAYCRWAGRRLPTEAEWEFAASAEPEGSSISTHKRLYPWGDEPPEPGRANLDGRLLGTVDVAAFPDGESAYGLRQMMGNVWEWCADAFGPYPGFVPDPYDDYSEPWFTGHKVQRGGSWATRGRMLRNTWRYFAMPDRHDIFAGFRTCAV